MYINKDRSNLQPKPIKNGSHPCSMGCGKTISQNKAMCYACLIEKVRTPVQKTESIDAEISGG